MTDRALDDTRLFWGELYMWAFRLGPRLESVWGTCPACYLGASDAGRWCGVTWCYCASCRVRWPLPDLPLEFELDPLPEDVVKTFAILLAECAELESLLPGASPSALHGEETTEMKTKVGAAA